MKTRRIHSIQPQNAAGSFARAPCLAALACLVLGLAACATHPPPTREQIHEQTDTLTKMPLAEPWKAAAPSIRRHPGQLAGHLRRSAARRAGGRPGQGRCPGGQGNDDFRPAHRQKPGLIIRAFDFIGFQEQIITRMVQCIKLGREAEGLAFPPVPGDLGKRIYDNVSKEAWAAWTRHQTMLINEDRLSLADPQARKYLMTQLEQYFFGAGADQVAGYVPPAK